MTKKRLNIITIKGIKDFFRNEGTILPPPPPHPLETTWQNTRSSCPLFRTMLNFLMLYYLIIWQKVL